MTQGRNEECLRHNEEQAVLAIDGRTMARRGHDGAVGISVAVQRCGFASRRRGDAESALPIEGAEYDEDYKQACTSPHSTSSSFGFPHYPRHKSAYGDTKDTKVIEN